MLRLTNANHFFKYFHRIAQKNTANTQTVIEKIEAKVKGTFVEQWVRYWKNVFIDYRDVALDLGTQIKEKPIKSITILWGVSGLIVCAKCNPNEIHFRDEYLKCANKLIVVHPNIQNNESYQHLKYIETCYNKRLVRRLNFGIGSIIWVDDNSSSCDSYNANCPYLQMQYSKFKDKIIDVGFLNRWWILGKKMDNYDINY